MGKAIFSTDVLVNGIVWVDIDAVFDVSDDTVLEYDIGLVLIVDGYSAKIICGVK